MSRRCSICDFSPDIPSVYNEGLVTSDRPFVNRITKRIKGEDVCDHCYEEMKNLYGKPIGKVSVGNPFHGK